MKHYLDKLILFLICMVLYIPKADSRFAVVPVIVALTISAAGSWLENKETQVGLTALYWLISMRYPVFVFFLPFLFYDLFATRYQLFAIAILLPVYLSGAWLTVETSVQIFVIVLLAWLQKNRYHRLESLQHESLQLRDETTEQALKLEQKNKDLLEKQEYEVHLATLNERNRIARDIHDHVGHLLTRALLQVGAIKVTHQEETLQKQLSALDQTLNDSMHQIRSSLHDLRDESIDLLAVLNELTGNNHACQVDLDYDITTTPPSVITLAFIAIAREALANINRHAQATWCTIIVREHPSFYQLIIRDNGKGCPPDILAEANQQKTGVTERNLEVENAAAKNAFAAYQARLPDGGMGLASMTDRIMQLNGQINFRSQATKPGQPPGFEIFITVPKNI